MGRGERKEKRKEMLRVGDGINNDRITDVPR